MTPKGKEARRAMLEELEGEGFKARFELSARLISFREADLPFFPLSQELEVRVEVTPTSRKLAELFNGSHKVPRVS